MSSLRLRIVPPHGEPFDHPVSTDSMIVGRGSDADLSLADRFLSRHHARLFRNGETLLVEDLGSRNGTQVNGETIHRATPVSPGDVITVCGTRITVEEEATVRSQDSSAMTMFRAVSEMLEEERADSSQIKTEGELRRFADRLHLLNEVHSALAESMEIDELLELILDRVFEELKPEQGAIFLRRGEGEYDLAAARSVKGLDSDFPFSRSLQHEVVEKGMAALVFDASIDERFAAAQSIMASGVRSLIAAPLPDPEGALGMIALNSRATVRHFSEDDMELLVSLASVASLRLRNVKLAEEVAQRRILEKEMELARRIQMTLLPSTLPDLPGWLLHAGTRPSRTVSGDYFQVVERDGSECVLMVADVAGKGMAASLLTASLEALAAGPIEDGMSPPELCDAVGGRLFRRTPPEKYATAFVATLDPATGRLVYTNAGHNPSVVIRADGDLETLTATGTPLGLIPGAKYGSGETTLEPGDTLLVYTDGVTETSNPREEEYGLDRLLDFCREHRSDRPDDLVKTLEKELVDFAEGLPFGDDVTMVLAKRSH